jgi:hypothetical protein
MHKLRDPNSPTANTFAQSSFLASPQYSFDPTSIDPTATSLWQSIYDSADKSPKELKLKSLREAAHRGTQESFSNEHLAFLQTERMHMTAFNNQLRTAVQSNRCSDVMRPSILDEKRRNEKTKSVQSHIEPGSNLRQSVFS